MNHDDNVEQHDQQWIRKVIYKKARVAKTVENLTQIDTTLDSLKNATIVQVRGSSFGEKLISDTNIKAKVAKTNKLIFKTRKATSKPIFKLDKQSVIEEVESLDRPRVRSKRPVQILEYRKGKDGYSLLAFDKSEITNVSDSFNSNFSDYESFSDEFDDVEEKLVQNMENESYSYSKYLLMWKEIKSGIPYDFLPVPASEIGSLNCETVVEFIGGPKNLKRERVRWHPDKMRNVLLFSKMWNTDHEKQVTKIFQIINEAFRCSKYS